MKADFLAGYKHASESIIRDLKQIIDKMQIDESAKKELLMFISEKQKKMMILEKNMKLGATQKPDYNLSLGKSYIINEKKPKLVFTIFKQVLDKSYPGICVSRINPSTLDIYKNYPEVNYYWLTKLDRGTNSLGAKELPLTDLSKISSKVQEFLSQNHNSVILLDGIESMINNTSFNSVLKMVESLKDYVSENRGILLVTLDFDILDEKQKSFIMREFEYVFEETKK
jgi:F0F1-type ATP synthase delta subunit